MKLTHPLQIAPLAALALAALIAPLTPAKADPPSQPTAGPNGDGAYPTQAMTLGSDGNLYGVTPSGGFNGYGTLFRFRPGRDSHPDVLIDFTKTGYNGTDPSGPVVEDEQGDFLGVTEYGGRYNKGTIYAYTANNHPRTLYSFGASSTSGSYPIGALVEYAPGEFAGTTYDGSTGNAGSVYTFVEGQFSSQSGLEPTILSPPVFTGFKPAAGSGGKGANPTDGLTLGPDNLLYGTALHGGDFKLGTVFSFDPYSRQLRMIHSFKGTDQDGSHPYAPLLFVPTGDSQGTLYGVCFDGGANQYGTIFAIPEGGDEHTIHNFSGQGGATPQGALTLGADDEIYGTASNYGGYDDGEFFQLTDPGFAGDPDTAVTGPYFAFGEPFYDAAFPVAGPTYDPGDGLFYGMTQKGGRNNLGTIYSIAPPSPANGNQYTRTVLHSFGDPSAPN